MRGGKRASQGRKSEWGRNPETKTIRVPVRYESLVKKFAADLHRQSSCSELLIWWTTEQDCRLIGEPHNRIDLEREPFYPYHQYWGFCCIEDLPLPEYLKPLYCARYGRPGRGRIWVAEHISKPEIVAPNSDAGGIVFFAQDLPAVRLLPGLITRPNGMPWQD